MILYHFVAGVIEVLEHILVISKARRYSSDIGSLTWLLAKLVTSL